MKKVLATTFLALGLLSTNVSAKDSGQDIRIITSADNHKVDKQKQIEAAFEKYGFSVDGNNNMNAPFSKRFTKIKGTHDGIWYPIYRLATVHNPDMVAKLAKKYPSIGLITPLSMSIYSEKVGAKENTLSISSLTLRGMSRITQIPMTNPDLVKYAELMKKAVQAALPKGKFQKVSYEKVTDLKQSLSTTFEAELEVEEGDELRDVLDDFQDEFTGELEPIGFLFPGYIGVNDELLERGVDVYNFYDTMSICKLDVIHPVSKDHPEVGAFAPCSFYFYQKKGETAMHMGFPSVTNWINSTDLKDEYSIKPLETAQKLLEDTVREITE